MKKLLPYIVLQMIILIYSLGGICSKTAASKEFLSFEWILFYGLVLLSLGIYAVLWQQVLKKVNLNVAYASKAVTLIWSTLWGVLIFHETISWNNIFGGVIVLAGVILMVTGGDKKHE